MLAVIIPAYNEETTVALTVEACSRLRPVSEIIVVDDGSRDGTAEAARRAGARVLRLGRNCGKGEALNLGLRHTRAPYLAFVDADIGATAGELKRLWEPVEAGILDMAVGVLSPSARRSPGLVRTLARVGVYRLAGCRLRAPLSGQRVLDARVAQSLYPLAGGFGVEVDLTVRALWAGFRVGELPVAMSHRYTGNDWAGISHRSRQLWEVGCTLWRISRTRRC
ncbi:MAG: glycosyltransferase family 2 protein [Moorellales bacterium]